MKNPEVADLREALRQLLTDMFIAQGNMRDAAKRDPAWEGCAEAIQPRVDAARAALEKYPEASAISEGDVETVSLPAKEWNAMAFWLGRCEDKGHLERCSDLLEPWAQLQAAILAMDYRRSSTAPMQSEDTP